MRILSTLFTGTTQNATQAANTIADDLLSMLPVKIAARTALLHIIKTAAMSGGGVVIIPLELLGALGITLGSEVILPVVASCFFSALLQKINNGFVHSATYLGICTVNGVKSVKCRLFTSEPKVFNEAWDDADQGLPEQDLRPPSRQG